MFTINSSKAIRTITRARDGITAATILTFTIIRTIATVCSRWADITTCVPLKSWQTKTLSRGRCTCGVVLTGAGLAAVHSPGVFGTEMVAMVSNPSGAAGTGT